MLRKSTNLIIDPVIISSTDIGAEICFDPVGLYIFFRFQTGLFRIIKGTGIFCLLYTSKMLNGVYASEVAGNS